jgi:hypothetical protein
MSVRCRRNPLAPREKPMWKRFPGGGNERSSSVSLLEHDRVRAKLAENMSGERESRAGCLQQLARDRAHPYDWPNAS